MSVDKNEFEQPIGFPVDNWQPRRHPPKAAMKGNFCTVEPIDVAKYGRSLFEANLNAEDDRNGPICLMGLLPDLLITTSG